jgi:hypothetical protein
MSNGSTKTCNGCQGRGILSGQGGRPFQCPNCGGTGVNQQVFRVPFDYVWPSIVLTALQKGLPATLQIDQDSDFEWIWVVGDRTGAYSIQLRDGSTGRTLSNNAVNDDNFAGTAQLPFPLVEPYLIARSTVMTASVNDLSNAGNTIQLVFRGYKLFPVSAPQQGSSGLIVNQ